MGIFEGLLFCLPQVMETFLKKNKKQEGVKEKKGVSQESSLLVPTLQPTSKETQKSYSVSLLHSLPFQ